MRVLVLLVSLRIVPSPYMRSAFGDPIRSSNPSVQQSNCLCGSNLGVTTTQTAQLQLRIHVHPSIQSACRPTVEYLPHLSKLLRWL
ncbi:hypothetical protein F4805DRAFT_321852 [Annulohypoxylon moriforme]|nr:hypothetical protein F4805DRAFT_321852 [Annulohypoxylon moriforme]